MPRRCGGRAAGAGGARRRADGAAPRQHTLTHRTSLTVESPRQPLTVHDPRSTIARARAVRSSQYRELEREVHTVECQSQRERPVYAQATRVLMLRDDSRPDHLTSTLPPHAHAQLTHDTQPRRHSHTCAVAMPPIGTVVVPGSLGPAGVTKPFCEIAQNASNLLIPRVPPSVRADTCHLDCRMRTTRAHATI